MNELPVARSYNDRVIMMTLMDTQAGSSEEANVHATHMRFASGSNRI